MRINAALANFRTGPEAGQRRPADTPRSACRALVPLAPAPLAASRCGPHSRPDAAFLAQLIATAQGAPQTRERRRAEPSDAIHRYGLRMQTTKATGALVGTM